MADDFEIRIDGLNELIEDFGKLARSVDPDKVEPITLNCAKRLAAALKVEAPEGPTKNLRKAVKAKLLKRIGNSQPAPAIAAVDRKIAPHAHLVERGTGERIDPKTGKSSGVMPADPFFRRTLDNRLQPETAQMMLELANLIEGAIK